MRKWKNDIRMDLKQIGLEVAYWIQMVQGGDQ
jgi:hypothetical protein